MLNLKIITGVKPGKIYKKLTNMPDSKLLKKIHALK